MNVLVINAGSSSLKYQLIDMDTQAVLAKGLCERIGIEGSRLKHTPEGKDSVTLQHDYEFGEGEYLEDILIKFDFEFKNK